jgi:hypothetical protein
MMRASPLISVAPKSNGSGYFYYPVAIAPEHCALASGDIAPLPTEASSIGAVGLPSD